MASGFGPWKIDITAYYDDFDDRGQKIDKWTNTPIPVAVNENRTTKIQIFSMVAHSSHPSEDINNNDIIGH